MEGNFKVVEMVSKESMNFGEIKNKLNLKTKFNEQ